ncbi:MAG: DUF1360 domain-containing protein [Vicinamibacterales bacterium]
MIGVWLAAGILATWRVTHLIVAEDGPWDIVARLRRLAGAGVLGQLMDCFYCASLWVAIPIALWIGDDGAARVVIWLALSGGAALLERAVPPRNDAGR